MNQEASSALSIPTWLSSVFPITFLFLIYWVLGNQLLENDQILFSVCYGVVMMASLGMAFIKKPSDTLINWVNRLFLWSILFNLACAVGSALDVINWISYQPVRLIILMATGLFGTMAVYLNRHRDEQRFQQDLQTPSRLPQWSVFLLLTVIFGVALYFRWLYLDMIDTFRDEDHHITGARTLLTAGYFEYQRAKLVTYSTALFAWLGHAVDFHEYMHWGRIPGTILGALAAIPIYFLGKRISQGTGIFAAFLWAMSPWAIGVSRNIREHTYYVFIILLFMLLFLTLIEKIVHYKKGDLGYIIGSSILVFALLVYSFFIDRFSTLKVSGAIFATLTGTYVLTHGKAILDLIKRNKILLFLGVGGFAGFLVLINRVKFIGLNNTTDIRWTDAFLFSGAQLPVHWWQADNPDMYFVYFLILMALFGGIRFRKNMSVAYTFSFILIASAFYFFFTRYFTPRYIFYNLSFFVLSIAASIYFIFRFGKNISNRFLRWGFQGLCAIFLLVIFNPQNTYLSLAEPQYAQNDFALKTTGEFHNEKRQLLFFLNQFEKEKIENEYTIISSIYEQLLYHNYDIECIHKYKYKDRRRKKDVDKIVQDSKSGLMILDFHRNQKWRVGFPVDTSKILKIGGKDVQLIFNQQLCQVYGWGELIEPPSDQVDLEETYVTETEANLMHPFSLSFWVKAPQIGVEQENPFYITSVDDDINLINVLLEKQLDGTHNFMLKYGSMLDEKDQEMLTFPFPNDTTWHHIVMYQAGGFKGSPYQVALDGVPKGVSKLPVHRLERGEFYITNDYLDNIKNFKYYERALSREEMQTLLKEGIELDPYAPIAEDAKIVNPLYEFEYEE